MPMHDWTRVEPNEFHDLHVGWLAAIRHALNTGVLPGGYYALAEQVVPPVVPDILTVERPGGGVPAANGGTAVAPRTAVTDTGRWRARRPERWVAVRHTGTNRLVAVIEIVSPGNKAGRRKFGQLIDKAIGLLHHRVHVLLVDPFPPTRRDPRGLHDAVWRSITRRRFEPPAGRPLTLASYAALGDDEFTAYVEPLAVGDTMPDMPVFLAPPLHVNVPLEATYQTAFAGCPGYIREQVSG